MNIIFLDIDGVLNNSHRCQWIHENAAPGGGYGQPWELAAGNINEITVGWDIDNVNALHYIISETGAQIVISSTWRHQHRIPAFRQFFVPFGEIPPIIGMTPIINTSGRIRGDEVNAWLAQEPQAERWVCLDDDSDYYSGNNLILIDRGVGLTMGDAQQAVNILNDIE